MISKHLVPCGGYAAVGISQLIYLEVHGLIVWAAWVQCKDACGLCLLLCVLQVWLRFAHIQGLRWVPGRLSLLTVYAGHRHWRLPASAPYWWQRRELPSVKPPQPPQPPSPTPPLVTLVDPNPGIRPFRSTHGLQGKLLKSPTHYLFFSVLPIIINKMDDTSLFPPLYKSEAKISDKITLHPTPSFKHMVRLSIMTFHFLQH